MKFQRLLSFLFTSVTAGLAAAILVLVLRPDILEDAQQRSEPTTAPAPGPARSRGAVSYAQAVRDAAPSVVNIYTTKVRQQRRSWLFDDPMFRHFFGDRISPEPRRRLEWTVQGTGEARLRVGCRRTGWVEARLALP